MNIMKSQHKSQEPKLEKLYRELSLYTLVLSLEPRARCIARRVEEIRTALSHIKQG